MVQMIPDIISPEIKSTAEKNLFSRFRSTETPNKVVILHSLGVAEHVNNIFGEIDFVVICREGFLCMEVKGGAVERSNGFWSYTNRYGKRESKSTGPFFQAQGNMQSLRKYMVTRFGENHPYSRAQYANCVLMPDCSFTHEGLDIIPDILFDSRSGCRLNDIIKWSFAYWKNELIRAHGFSGGSLTDDQIDEAAKLLRGDFHFVPSLKDVVYNTYQELLALTDEQYDVLEALEENPRVLISGLAGTGKSVLAVEQCKRALRCNRSVLYLCYNRNMARYVNHQFEKESLEGESATLHAMMDKICGIRHEEHDSYYYQTVLPQRFLQTDEQVRQFDLVVIDEAQDLINPVYLRCIARLVKGGLESGHWAIYYDPNQNIYNHESEMTDELPRLKTLSVCYALTVNCRNTKEIANTNTLITNIPQVNRIKASGPKVEQIPYRTVDDEWDRILHLIEQLHDEGIRNGDIVILSAYNVENGKCVFNGRKLPASLGKLKTEGRMWGAKQDELRFSTIHAFKGLEAKVVIFADLDDFTEASRKLLNYVAISRAEALLYIFYSEQLEEDRQMMMRNGYVKLIQTL